MAAHPVISPTDVLVCNTTLLLSSFLQIVEGEWFDDPNKPHARRHKTQNQEMLGYYLGVWGVRTVAFMQFFGWFGEYQGMMPAVVWCMLMNMGQPSSSAAGTSTSSSVGCSVSNSAEHVLPLTGQSLLTCAQALVPSRFFQAPVCSTPLTRGSR